MVVDQLDASGSLKLNTILMDKYKYIMLDLCLSYSQRDGIDFNETFSPVSSNDSFRVIMTIVAHFNLELHQ